MKSLASSRRYPDRYASIAVLGIALLASGGVARADVAVSWGSNSNGQLGNGSNISSTFPVAVTGLSSGVTGIAAGQTFSLAIQNGAAVAWGYNSNGQLGNNTTNSSSTFVAVSSLSSGVTSVAAGSSFGLAIQNGAAYAWGNNHEGELGSGTFTSGSNIPVPVYGLSQRQRLCMGLKHLRPTRCRLDRCQQQHAGARPGHRRQSRLRRCHRGL